MYMPYHEMDISRFVEAVSKMMHERRSETRLRYYRDQLGISQSELADRSGVPLRQIQLFEQPQQQINHTQAENLVQAEQSLQLGAKLQQARLIGASDAVNRRRELQLLRASVGDCYPPPTFEYGTRRLHYHLEAGDIRRLLYCKMEDLLE